MTDAREIPCAPGVVPAPVRLKRASVLCYRIFDVADEVNLVAAERCISQGTSRLRLSRDRSRYLHLPNPPLNVDLEPRQLALESFRGRAETVARIFDHGAISVILRLELPSGLTLSDVVPIAAEVQDAPALDEVALELVENLRRAIDPAVEGAHLWDQSESYTIVLVSELEERVPPEQLLENEALAKLLIGEIESLRLSASERSDVLRHHFSYSDADLTVIDWNGAFVYDPSGDSDIADVLEIANAQLLELRYYDEQLDQHMQSIYDEMQRRRRRWYAILLSPYRRLARRVLVTLFELSEFIERVENSLKVIGDVYLAKVYEAALLQLRVPNWQASVTRKQEMLENTYQLLKGDVDTDRSLALEALIVGLIVLEIVLALLAVH